MSGLKYAQTSTFDTAPELCINSTGTGLLYHGPRWARQIQQTLIVSSLLDLSLVTETREIYICVCVCVCVRVRVCVRVCVF